MRDHQIDYVNEKLECIFTGRSVMKNIHNDAYSLPDKTITTDAGMAAEKWSSAFYQLKDALSRSRPVPEMLLLGKPVKDLDETILECDAALSLGEN